MGGMKQKRGVVTGTSLGDKPRERETVLYLSLMFPMVRARLIPTLAPCMAAGWNQPGTTDS